MPAIMLPWGKVLVPAAMASISYLSQRGIYDPVAGAWATVGSLATARLSHTATVLPNGKVLAAGGYNGACLASAELYDPAIGAWTTTASLAALRELHTATLLPDGQVLAAGGYTNPPSGEVATSELYDPGLGYAGSSQPQIGTCTSPLGLGGSLALTGSGFRGLAKGPPAAILRTRRAIIRWCNSGAWRADSPCSCWRPTGRPMPSPPRRWAFAARLCAGNGFRQRHLQHGASSTSACRCQPHRSNQCAMADQRRVPVRLHQQPGSTVRRVGDDQSGIALSGWTLLSGVTEVAPGQFQFTDPQAATPRMLLPRSAHLERRDACTGVNAG